MYKEDYSSGYFSWWLCQGCFVFFCLNNHVFGKLGSVNPVGFTLDTYHLCIIPVIILVGGYVKVFCIFCLNNHVFGKLGCVNPVEFTLDTSPL